jgi:twinkle protein
MRAIEYHLLTTTDHNIGIIHLEEQEKRSVQGLVSYELQTPCHLPTSSASKEDQIEAYKRITKRDGRLSFYTHFGSDDPDSILDTIRYLVTVCHCKFIFLDHITMLVTGFEDDDERKKLDYISTRLAMLTRELNFTLFLVSHVNDDGKTRGSRNISKIADLIVHLDRDIESADPSQRNRTNLLVKGNRFGGTTGPAGCLLFNSDTYTIKEVDDTELEKQRTAAGVVPF